MAWSPFAITLETGVPSTHSPTSTRAVLVTSSGMRKSGSPRNAAANTFWYAASSR